jgi:hypothetical protein
MSEEEINEIIDALLQKIVTQGGYPYLDTLISSITGNDDDEPTYNRVKEILLRDGLVDYNAQSDKVWANNETHSIVKNGGYLKHLEAQKIEREEEKKRKNEEAEFNRTQGKLAEWNYNKRYATKRKSNITLIVAVCSLLVSIIALLRGCC